jgi:lysophospholipase L1-like esterase
MSHAFPTLLACLFALGGPPAERFSLTDGDRVVFLGGGFFEQERLYGLVETCLTSRFPDANVVFRNLGWSGDTVRGEARTEGFQNPDGMARLLKEVRELKPTVLLLAYGMNESFAGADGLGTFIADYDKLLAKLDLPKARLVILSPTYHEDLSRPLPDPAEHNRDLAAYTAALKKLAAQRGLPFIDLFHALETAKQANPSWRLTTNGIHLTEAGHLLAARAIEEQLGWPARTWRVEIDANGKLLAPAGTMVDMVSATDGPLSFRTVDTLFPTTAIGPVPGDVQTLRVTGLPPGEYALKIDGKEVCRAAAAGWQKGVPLSTGPAFSDFQALREAVVHKDQLFYRRWRPFNDHSRHWDFIRGDFGLYDQEIAREEEKIAKARRPRPHTYEVAKIH